MAETSCAKVAGADRRAGKANEAWALYKWNHPGCPWVTFPMPNALIMPKVSLPRWKHSYLDFFRQACSRTSLLYCAPKTILPYQVSHCKIQPKLQSWQAKCDHFKLVVGLKKILGIKGHSSANYNTFARHLFYKPNRSWSFSRTLWATLALEKL